MTELINLSTHLKTLSISDWQKLFDMLPEMEITKDFGKMSRMKKNDKGVLIFPSMEWAPITSGFFRVVHELGIVPVFDWKEWEEGRLMLDNKELDFSSLEIITLCKLLTIIIRADRFVDGYLVGQLKRKNVQKIIRSIQDKIQRQSSSQKP
ncbi:MAG: DUF6508 domain-containing protein [Bacteroidetes bacterium]|nr:DUF6508 domain-containing protein [Bacteroidota bacterium]